MARLILITVEGSMELTDVLQKLAQLSGSPLPIISVYLNAQPAQRDRSAAFLAPPIRRAQMLTMDDEAAQESVEHDLKQLAQWRNPHLHRTAGESAEGYALFACHGVKLWIEFPFYNGLQRLSYQRHVWDSSQRHDQEMIAYLNTYLHEHPNTVVILGGSDDALRAFRAELPRQVQQTAGRGGLAVLGLYDTLIAVNAGLVDTLMMHRDFHRQGWCCRDCSAIDEGQLGRCPLCSGEVMIAELGEAMVSETLRQHGYVELIDPGPRIASYHCSILSTLEDQ